MKAIFVILALTLAGIARADVADSANNGFTAKIVLTIQASPDEVYRRLVGNIGDWWNSAHTFTGDSHNLTIEAKPMGCFCEKLPSGGARHMEVVNFVPGKTLVMVGGLGPLQSLAVAAIILGAIGIPRANRLGGLSRRMAIAGLVCGIVAIGVVILYITAIYTFQASCTVKGPPC